jgi:hypothetical protein
MISNLIQSPTRSRSARARPLLHLHQQAGRSSRVGTLPSAAPNRTYVRFKQARTPTRLRVFFPMLPKSSAAQRSHVGAEFNSDIIPLSFRKESTSHWKSQIQEGIPRLSPVPQGYLFFLPKYILCPNIPVSVVPYSKFGAQGERECVPALTTVQCRSLNRGASAVGGRPQVARG